LRITTGNIFTVKAGITLLILSGTLLTITTKAQVFTGGNVSVSYENGLYADIAPVIGYQLDKARAGVSPILSYKVSGSLSNFSYGGRIFGQYNVYQGAFAHAEFQALNAGISTLLTDGTRSKDRKWAFSLPVGAGYEYKISDKAKLQVSVLYDLLQDKNTPAGKPVVRGGIIYDL
jgi:opacity protein-like surface antigen